MSSCTANPRLWSSLSSTLNDSGTPRLTDGFALDDGLVGLDATGDVVGLDCQNLLQIVGGAVGLQGPDFHFTEALAAELGLAAQRLLSDHRVGSGDLAWILSSTRWMSFRM